MATYSDSITDVFGLGSDFNKISLSLSLNDICSYTLDGIWSFGFFSDNLTYIEKEPSIFLTIPALSYLNFVDSKYLILDLKASSVDFSFPFGADRVSYNYYILIKDLVSLLDFPSYKLQSRISLFDKWLTLVDIIGGIDNLAYYRDVLGIKDNINILLLSNTLSVIDLLDSFKLIFPTSILEAISLSDNYCLLLDVRFSDLLLPFLDVTKLFLNLKHKEVFNLSDLLSSIANISASFEDFLFFIDAIFFTGKPEALVFFSLVPYIDKILYSLYSTSIRVTGVDGILTAEDGIYIFDEERTTGDLIFRFGSLGSSRLKKIDKIFANVPLESATIYTDNNSYTYTGNMWINCGRGLKSKELKILIENLDNLEFISFRLAELGRAK